MSETTRHIPSILRLTAILSVLLTLLALAASPALAQNRFQDQGDGTVLDSKTGLLWLKDASCATMPGTFKDGATKSQAAAKSAAAALANGTCGLSDGSKAGDWRLPTIQEFCSAWSDKAGEQCPGSAADSSLLNTAYKGPALSNAAGSGHWSDGNPFTGVVSHNYWSSTPRVNDGAWWANLNDGKLWSGQSTGGHATVWPVRQVPMKHHIAIPDHPWQLDNAKKSGWTCEPAAQSIRTCHKGDAATLVPDHPWWLDNMKKAGWTCNPAPNSLRFCTK